MAQPPSEPMGGQVEVLLRRARSPVGLALIADREVAWARVRGAPPKARFLAGSISKSVTACAALALAGQSSVDLDGDVNERLVSWSLPGPQHTTLRQLLGHTAGVTVPFFPGYEQGEATPSVRDVLDGTPPARTPAVQVDRSSRGSFCYSGGGYVIVQQLVADVTGVSFAEAARTLVLDPLGMSSSSFEQPLPEPWRPWAARADWRVYPEAAAAGLWTTPEDLARFACRLQSAAGGQPSPLHPAVARSMLTPHVRLPRKGEWNLFPLLGVSPPDSIGLGMFLHRDDRFGHTGGASSFFAMLAASLADGTGGVVMIAANASPYPFRLLRAMSRQYGWEGFSIPAWRRPTGLPGLRRLM